MRCCFESATLSVRFGSRWSGDVPGLLDYCAADSVRGAVGRHSVRERAGD